MRRSTHGLLTPLAEWARFGGASVVGEGVTTSEGRKRGRGMGEWEGTKQGESNGCVTAGVGAVVRCVRRCVGLRF